MCFEYDVFHNDLNDNVWKQVYSQKYCRLLPTQEFMADFSVGINSSPKIPKNCPQQSYFLAIAQDYSLQSRTLLNFVTNDFLKTYRNSSTKNFEKYPEKGMQLSFLLTQLHEYSLQPTIGLKTPLQMHSGSSQKREGVLNFQKFQKNLFKTIRISRFSKHYGLET